eukprot:5786897-Pyramimonas_sp.AAC.1
MVAGALVEGDARHLEDEGHEGIALAASSPACRQGPVLAGIASEGRRAQVPFRVNVEKDLGPL